MTQIEVEALRSLVIEQEGRILKLRQENFILKDAYENLLLLSCEWLKLTPKDKDGNYYGPLSDIATQTANLIEKNLGVRNG